MLDLIKEDIVNEEIAALYKIYNDAILQHEDKASLQDVLVQLSQERMHTKVVEKEHFKWGDDNDRYSLRILYELALAHYEEAMFYESLCEFELLSVLCDDTTFSTSMKKHLFALDQEFSFEDFINEWTGKHESDTFFMQTFDFDFEKQFSEHLPVIDEKLEKVKKLFI